MKSIRVAGAVLAALALAGTVRAADMSVYKAPPALATPSPWTGFYAGFGVGFRATRTDARTLSETFAGIPNNVAALAASLPFDGTAFRANPYIGFNWQITPRWVAGIEGDVGFAGQTTTLAGYPFSPGADIGSGVAADGLAVKATADGSLRGRFGFLFAPATLAYLAGGVAWQRYEVASRCVSNTPCAGNGFSPGLVTNAATRSGWTVGGGVETAFSGHWVARAEYRYADFGTAPFAIARSSTVPSLNPTVDNFDVTMRTHTAMFGFAYKFGNSIPVEEVDGAAGAFAAGTTPAATSWTGAYAGLGLGARASRTDVTTTSSTQGLLLLDLTRVSTSMPLDGTAFRAAPYFGVAWQFAPQWVAGLDGDTGLAKQTRTLSGLPFSPGVVGGRRAEDALAVKTTWDASLRARLGFLLTPATLAYLTGGVAWQHYEVASVCASASVCGAFGFAPVTMVNSTIKSGWTVGGGIETAISGHWLARGEYRYSDFGGETFSIARSSLFAASNPTVANFETKMRTHIVSFGLAYKFN